MSKGRWLIDAKFSDASRFAQNGLAAVRLNGGKRGYINQDGKMVIDAKFEVAENFAQNGLALVKLNGKYGYVNERGKMVIDAKFDYTSGFTQNGLARIGMKVIAKKDVKMPSVMDLTICSNIINELQKMTGVNYQYQVTNKYGAIKSVGLSSICQNYPLYVQRYVDAGKDIEVLETFIKRVPLSQTSDFEKFRSSQSDKKAATKYYKNEIWEKGYLDPLNGDGTEVAKCFLRDCSKSEEAHVGVNSEGYQLFIKGLVTNDFDLADKMVDKSQ